MSRRKIAAAVLCGTQSLLLSDACRERVPEGTTLCGCRICNFDLCASCEQQIASPSKVDARGYLYWKIGKEKFTDIIHHARGA
jgi:hypothetical protein